MKVILAFDGTPAALRAAELLAGHAGAGALDVVALAAGDAATALERLPAALRAERVTRDGPAAQAIEQEARSRNAGLVVMGTRGAGPLRGFAFGSVALRVAHSGAAPTLLVKEDSRLPAAFGKRLRVLLGADGSAESLRAAQRLAAWRPWLGEMHVDVVHVQAPLTVLEAVLPPHDDVQKQWSNAPGEAAAKAVREALSGAGISTKLHLSAGEAPLELAQLAEDCSSDLLALGTRGLGVAHHALAGSVALKAAALSRVPVLLVAS